MILAGYIVTRIAYNACNLDYFTCLQHGVLLKPPNVVWITQVSTACDWLSWQTPNCAALQQQSLTLITRVEIYWLNPGTNKNAHYFPRVQQRWRKREILRHIRIARVCFSLLDKNIWRSHILTDTKVHLYRTYRGWRDSLD